MSRLEVFTDLYAQLTEVPINDMIGELFANNLLPGDHKATIKSLSTPKEKAQHFLDEVIKPSLKIGYTEQFDKLISIIESSDNPTLQFLAQQIRGRLPDVPAADLHSSSCEDKYMHGIIIMDRQ